MKVPHAPFLVFISTVRSITHFLPPNPGSFIPYNRCGVRPTAFAHALLSIEHEEGVALPADLRRTLELLRRKGALGITHPQRVPCRIIVGDGDDQLARRVGLPHKIALEIGKHHLARLDLSQQFLEGAVIGIFKQA